MLVAHDLCYNVDRFGLIHNVKDCRASFEIAEWESSGLLLLVEAFLYGINI